MSKSVLLLALLTLCSLAPTAAAAQSAPASRLYVASSGGQVHYAAECDAARRLRRQTLRYFSSPAEAEAAGYRPSTARACAPQLDTALIRPSINGRAECVVRRIIDGDTFQCAGGSHIRLLLADADEAGQSVYADSAVLLLQRLMNSGSRVDLEFDVQLRDRYDRLLAYVYAGNLLVNRELVRRGLAQVSVYPPNVGKLDLIRAAADSAQDERLGVWRRSAFLCAPSDFRAGRCRRP